MKYIITLLIISMTYNSHANRLNILEQRNNSSSGGISFTLFPSSLISCSSLRENDDFLVRFHPSSSGNYTLFERMYSSQKNCTVEQDLLTELIENDSCFADKLEQLSHQAIGLSDDFETELRNENSDILASYDSSIRFLIQDNRENFFQSALGFFSRDDAEEGIESCPWIFATHIKIKVIKQGEDEYHERIFEDSTF